MDHFELVCILKPDLTKQDQKKVNDIMVKSVSDSGGKVIEATDPIESQTVTVKGTRALRKDKKPVKATWY